VPSYDRTTADYIVERVEKAADSVIKQIDGYTRNVLQKMDQERQGFLSQQQNAVQTLIKEAPSFQELGQVIQASLTQQDRGIQKMIDGISFLDAVSHDLKASVDRSSDLAYQSVTVANQIPEAAAAFSSAGQQIVDATKQLHEIVLVLDDLLAQVGSEGIEERPASALYALARANIEDDNQAIVGRAYTVDVGFSNSKPEFFPGEIVDLSMASSDTPSTFDILLHTSENIELRTKWYQRLRYDPGNPGLQTVQFLFQVLAPGHSTLTMDFYQEQRWLSSTKLEFDAIEMAEFSSVSSEV